MPAFFKREALAAGWQLFRQNWLFLIGVTITSLVVGYLPTLVSGLLGENYPLPNFLLGLVFWLLGLLISIGFIRISLDLVDNQGAHFADLINGYGLLVKFIVTAVLVGLVVLAGLVLLIVPGIVWGIRLQLAMYFVVDQGAGPLAALKKSWAATRGSVINLLLFDVLLGLVSLLGILALGVGLLVTTPLTMLSMAWVYRRLSGGGSI